MVVREPQLVPWAFPNGSSHQPLNVVSKWMARAFPMDNFILHQSHTIKRLSGQVACSDHYSKRQSFEEEPETFKYITGGASETEDVEGPQGQSSCETPGKPCLHFMKHLLSQYDPWLFSKSAEAEFHALVSFVHTKRVNNLYKWFVSILPLFIAVHWCTEAFRQNN